MNRLLLVSIATLTAAACAPSYVYLPEENATATVAGRAAARYAIPPEAPQGDVRVASFGVAKVTPQGSSESYNALHVRMVVSNESKTPWKLDTRDQLISIANEGESRPIYASADRDGLPVIEIAPQDKRTVDLFYPLPADMQSAKRIPDFDVIWKVDTGTRPIAERTPFQRLEVEPQLAAAGSYSYDYSWGPYIWYDPFYPTLTFVHPYIPPRIYTIRPVHIGRPVWRR